MKSLTVEYRGFLDNGLDIQAGIRHDDNKVFDDFTSWNLGLSYRIPGQPVRLHASAAVRWSTRPITSFMPMTPIPLAILA